ncbi:Alginate biosynthesis sensor protein KinB [Arthrobacter saudimassiliensis]|uniref:histidine kinase n=1 Tax=Arthrobacter saudimassiliensis TaxID=1461584 RepID=A0A078MMJ9_9MICC|nr:Alginate biosynthesis sensor protein KinB [Arthrobacter saudimassiliensis]
MSSTPHGTRKLLGIRRQFHELNLRWRVFLSQLPLALTVLLALPMVWFVSPWLFTDPHFRTGLILLAALTAAAAAVPWHRLPPLLYWSIPLLDFVAIGYLYDSGRAAVLGLSLLAVFPVFWLAWSEIAPKTAAILSFFGTTLILWAPILGSPNLTAASLAATLLIPFIMVAVSVTTSVVSLGSGRQQRQLRSAESRVSASLAESRLRTVLLDAVLDAVDVGVLALAADGRELVRNARQEGYRQLVLPPAGAPCRGEGDYLLFAPDGRTPLTAEERPGFRALRGEAFSGCLIWAGVGERQRTLSVSARPMRDDEGGLTGSVLAFADVTELVSALRVKDEFVASVSHELRTPLTSIIGYMDLALEEAEDISLQGPIPAALQVSLRNAERLLALVSDLLSTASGAVAIDPAPMDLAQVVSDSLEAARPRAEAAQVRLVNESAGHLPLQADPGRLGQVLDNLLSNAIKYTPQGGTVWVRAGTNRDGVLVEVEDTGMGMSATEQSEVFTRFFRTAGVRRKAIPGVGLGLVISKSIVEAHGGRISFSSEPDVGTTFRVWLPAAPGAAPAETAMGAETSR